MPTLTIYSVSADLTTLYAIFNGVAMICKQTAFIWGFAFLACLWRLSTTVTAGAFRSVNGPSAGNSALASGSMAAFVPFILAFMLTTPGLKGTIELEATVNGALEEVDNVPLVISAIPAAGSVLSLNLNQIVSTAFGTVDADYPTISASANGFMNPMKMLLSSRTALYRLNGIDSEVKAVLVSCLGADSGVDYANLQKLVMNTGNTGATAAQSIEINGANPTSMGALLYQASTMTTGVVSDPSVVKTSGFLSCADAANQVANDITDALQSTEYARVSMGAVNGLDQPLPNADNSVNAQALQFDALATANAMGNVFTGGTAQANAEFMNLIFSEMVGNDLTCIRATGDALTQCQATALQASEVERNNLQEAASEVPMLRYAGSFGNYLIALIIGLGPVIVMFMMFAGMGVWKTVVTTAHIIVWPMLAVNVGAEIVNGMISISYGNFLNALRGGGYLSHATTLAAYKEMSLQIGTASHIMSSLPVLMSIIFGLGESSALTSVGTSIAPKSSDTTDNVAPRVEATQPMFQQSSIGAGTQMVGGAKLGLHGAVEAAASRVTYGNSAQELSNAISAGEQRSSTISESESALSSFRNALSTGDGSRLFSDSTTGQAFIDNLEKRTGFSHDKFSRQQLDASRGNVNTTEASMGAGGGIEVGGGIGAGSPPLSVGFKVGANAGAQTKAATQDALNASHAAGTGDNLSFSKAVSQALTDTMNQVKGTSHWSSSSKDLTRALDQQKSYQQTLSDTKTAGEQSAETARLSNSFVAQASSMGAEQIAWQRLSNADYQMFQSTAGQALDRNPAFQRGLDIAREEAASGATDRQSDPAAQAAVNRHRAAVLLAQDSSASAGDRMQAVKYLAQEGTAMFHGTIAGDMPRQLNEKIAAPVNRTGAALPAAGGGGITGGGGGGGHAHHEPHATPVAVSNAPSPMGQALASEVKGAVEQGGKTLDATLAHTQDVQKFAGLTQDGPGTVGRTAELVGNNVADAGRSAGTPSMVGVGDGRTPVPGSEPPAPKPPSKFVRR